MTSPLVLAYTALWSYISGLDEMARRLQMEAMTITYLIGLTVFMFLAGIRKVLPWEISPLTFLVLELIRGMVLVAVTRRYR